LLADIIGEEGQELVSVGDSNTPWLGSTAVFSANWSGAYCDERSVEGREHEKVLNDVPIIRET